MPVIVCGGCNTAQFANAEMRCMQCNASLTETAQPLRPAAIPAAKTAAGTPEELLEQPRRRGRKPRALPLPALHRSAPTKPPKERPPKFTDRSFKLLIKTLEAPADCHDAVLKLRTLLIDKYIQIELTEPVPAPLLPVSMASGPAVKKKS